MIEKESKKYQSGLKNFIELYTFADGKVLKWYFFSKKVRICLWFHEYRGQMIPFFIAKKESKDGYNITKESAPMLSREILRHLSDIENKKFDIIEI